MPFPKRSHSHRLETDSDAILRAVLPSQWLCRGLGERDYGVDYLIEMVGGKYLLTGHIAAIQLKATGYIKWRGQSHQNITDWFYSQRIPKRTVNYWMGLQLPVFLCVVESSTKKVFFVPVKRAIRRNYDLFLKNKTFRFRLIRFCELTNKMGQEAFTQDYHRERGYDHFIQRIMDIIAHQEQYLRLFRLAASPLRNSTFTPQDWVLGTNLAQTCLIILEHTGHSGEKDRINRQLGSLPKVSVRSNSKLTRGVFTTMLRELYPVFKKCLRLSKTFVTQEEAHYWKETDIQFYKICSTLVKQKFPRLKFS